MSESRFTFDDDATVLSVRHFTVFESLSRPFDVSVVGVSPDDDLDLAALVGAPATFHLAVEGRGATGGKSWSGLCVEAEQIQAESRGVSTYAFRLAPALARLDYRTNYRIFQHLSAPDVARRLLDEWRVPYDVRLESDYPRLPYKVQYGETDLAFLSRLLEEAGITYAFLQRPEGGARLVLADALERGEPRAEALPYVDNPNESAERAFVSRVRRVHVVRPGRLQLRDFDFRRPLSFASVADAPPAPAPEDAYERVRWAPGSFLVEAPGGGGDTPVADDRGAARVDLEHGRRLAARALEAERGAKDRIAFATNALDLGCGTVFRVEQHPSRALAPEHPLLIVDFTIAGGPHEETRAQGVAASAGRPHRPLPLTPRPRVGGVESAVVVGPPGEEIHTDEHGRVRVQFPWDREGRNDDGSSVWVRVSQGWAGGAYGMLTLPRVGQEVLVGFFGGDPDQPVVVGRVHDVTNPPPYRLPDEKTKSTWRSRSTPGGGGFNELTFDDKKGAELLYLQAERDLEKLVKHDERERIERDRTVSVGRDATQHVGGSETEVTAGDRCLRVGGTLHACVEGNREERVQAKHLLTVLGSQHLVTKGTKLVLALGDEHRLTAGARAESVGSQSLTVHADHQTYVSGRYALEANRVDVSSAHEIVLEAQRISLRTPDCFIDLGPAGVAISGPMVLLNSGGSPAPVTGAKPTIPSEADAVEHCCGESLRRSGGR